jgi:hypothetical protein
MASGFFILKQFQLLRGVWQLFFFLAVKQFHHTKLLIGYGHNAYMAFWREYFFNAFNMYIGIFATAAMAQVNGKLEHTEAVLHNILAELAVNFPVLFGFRWQVEKY